MNDIILGIIYYENDLVLHNKVKYINYIKINNILEIKETKKPCLIIGWNLVKAKYKNINILNKTIKNNLYWSFSFKEKKTDYIKYLNEFITIKVCNIFNNYNYNILSPIINNNLKINNDFINYFIDKKIHSIYLSKNKELSILSDKNIFKINLNELKFYNINSFLFLDFLSKKCNKIIHDKNGFLENKLINYFSEIDPVTTKKYIILFNKHIFYKK